MTVTCDDKRRVVLPGSKPGDRFDLKESGGAKVLTLLKPVKTRRVIAKLVRRGGMLIFEMPDIEIHQESLGISIAQAVREERESR